MIWIFLIVPISMAIYMIVKYVKSYKIPLDVCMSFTGSMGSGKSLLAVKTACGKCWGKQNMRRWKRNIFGLFKKHKWETQKPVIYSNIPIRSKYYRPLTPEMLKRQEVMQENCVILIDEFGGTIASQYDWADPTIQENLTAFIRYVRHWLDAFVIITDQTADSIPKPVRDRIGGEYYLSHFTKKFLLFYQIDIHPILHIGEDTLNVNNVKDNEEEQTFYVFGLLGKRLYNSRCFVETYHDGFVFNADDNITKDKLNTRLNLDMTSSPEVIKAFKTDKQKERQKIYTHKL